MREIEFSGYRWKVSDSQGEFRSPGPNRFSSENVMLDAEGRLHLKIARQDDQWTCSEVLLEKPLGYGNYSFFVIGDFTQFDPNTVVGLFLYKDDTHELDIEFARWGDSHVEPAQYAVQPFQLPGHLHRFNPRLTGTYSSHSISWREDRVNFQSFHGHQLDDSKEIVYMSNWTFLNPPFEPTTEIPIINFWLAGGNQPQNEEEAEIVIARFSHRELQTT